MSTGMEVGGSPNPPITPNQSPAPSGVGEGSTGTHSVTGPVPPVSQLGDLPPDQTTHKKLGERTATPTGGESVVGKKDASKEPESLEGLTKEELEEKQDKKFEELATATKRYETHSLMGRAKTAISDPLNAPKDLKVTVALPGKDPVVLIPWSDKVAALPNIADLRAIATKVLEEYEAANLSNYDKDKDFQLLGELQNSIRSIADKLGDNEHKEGVEGGFKNKWEKRFNEIRHKPVSIEAFEGHNYSDSASRVNAEKLPLEQQQQDKKETSEGDTPAED